MCALLHSSLVCTPSFSFIGVGLDDPGASFELRIVYSSMIHFHRGRGNPVFNMRPYQETIRDCASAMIRQQKMLWGFSLVTGCPRAGTDGVPAADHGGYDGAKRLPFLHLVLLYDYWLTPPPPRRAKTNLRPSAPCAVIGLVLASSRSSLGRDVSEPVMLQESWAGPPSCQAFALIQLDLLPFETFKMLLWHNIRNTGNDSIPLSPHAGPSPLSHS